MRVALGTQTFGAVGKSLRFRLVIQRAVGLPYVFCLARKAAPRAWFRVQTANFTNGARSSASHLALGFAFAACAATFFASVKSDSFVQNCSSQSSLGPASDQRR